MPQHAKIKPARKFKKSPIHRHFRRYDPQNHPLDSLKTHNSKAWSELAPQREKAQKTIRRYIVEVEK
jgi:hypothetical protein